MSPHSTAIAAPASIPADFFAENEVSYVTARTPLEFWRLMPDAYRTRQVYELLESSFSYPVIVAVSVVPRQEPLKAAFDRMMAL